MILYLNIELYFLFFEYYMFLFLCFYIRILCILVIIFLCCVNFIVYTRVYMYIYIFYNLNDPVVRRSAKD
jgi:hypothetical protein